MMLVRSKICGITNLNDALTAVKFGANALGLVFYNQSPRSVTVLQAKDIINNLPPFVTTVGLLVNANYSYINELLNELPLDLLQFHGDEDDNFCASFNKPYIKAIRVQSSEQIVIAEQKYADAKALLLDSYVKDKFGGTGHKFNWDLIPTNLTKPIILAGGLNEDNIMQAIKQVKPYAVDVSGGVESALGIKDKRKLAKFLATIAKFTNNAEITF